MAANLSGLKNAQETQGIEIFPYPRSEILGINFIPPPLPDHLDPVSAKRRIFRNHGNILYQGLGHDEAVKGIPVVVGQFRHRGGMRPFNGQ